MDNYQKITLSVVPWVKRDIHTNEVIEKGANVFADKQDMSSWDSIENILKQLLMQVLGEV
jgi:hypothetical protein